MILSAMQGIGFCPGLDVFGEPDVPPVPVCSIFFSGNG